MSASRSNTLSPRPRGILKNVSFRRDSQLAEEGRPSASLDLHKEQEQDETSPLIKPGDSDLDSPLTLSNIPSPENSDGWNEGEMEDTKSSWYLFLLTLSIGGLQIAWSVELSNGSVGNVECNL